MDSAYLERVAAAAHSTSSTLDPEPPADLQLAVASAVNHGETLAVVAATADLPSLAILDALEASQLDSH
jgi:hypothetical protein